MAFWHQHKNFILEGYEGVFKSASTKMWKQSENSSENVVNIKSSRAYTGIAYSSHTKWVVKELFFQVH